MLSFNFLLPQRIVHDNLKRYHRNLQIRRHLVTTGALSSRGLLLNAIPNIPFSNSRPLSLLRFIGYAPITTALLFLLLFNVGGDLVRIQLMPLCLSPFTVYF